MAGRFFKLIQANMSKGFDEQKKILNSTLNDWMMPEKKKEPARLEGKDKTGCNDTSDSDRQSK